MRIHIQNLLYATDFSELSNNAISYGITLAREFQAKLHLCHVIELHSASLYGEVQLDLPDIQRSNIEFAHHQFQQLLTDEAIAALDVLPRETSALRAIAEFLVGRKY